MPLTNTINRYRVILLDKLCRSKVPDRKALVEVVMILIVGILYGLYNPHQVARELDIGPKQLYRALKQLSAAAWRRLLERMMTQAALERLQQFQDRSLATQSRQHASLSIDDTVQKRLGKALSYVWAWYSGQAKRVINGQDLVGIVLRIGEEILPLRLVWVSKQGRGSTSKPAVVLKVLKELKAEFDRQGVDLTALGVSLDSWWINEEFSRALAALGFDKQVICGKSHLVLETEQERQSLRAHRDQLKLTAGWGHERPAHRVRGESPTFGEVAVVFFARPRTKAFALLCAHRLLRTCEALRLWENYHAVEVFWKRLKSWLGLGQMQLRGRGGAWAELALRGLAYVMAQSGLGLQSGTCTLVQLRHRLHRQGTFAELIEEHFHPVGLGIS